MQQVVVVGKISDSTHYAEALLAPTKVSSLVLLNTEIPKHRPHWIPFYRNLFKLPHAEEGLRWLFRSETFIQSGMGFGGCFHDSSLIDDEFREYFIHPLLRSRKSREGCARYLAGFDWGLVDGFAKQHAQIEQPVQFIWGKEDPTFPLSLAQEMPSQFPDCRGIEVLENTKLLGHEERPESVSNKALQFFQVTTRGK